MRRSRFVTGIGVFVLLLGSRGARADTSPSVGARLSIGGGMLTPPGETRARLFELAPRVEALWGRKVGVGPAIEFRTSNFGTAELSGGVTAIFTDGEVGAITTLSSGYSWRRNDDDGAVVAATIGYGIVHVSSRWLATSTFYVSFRHSATGPSRDEATVGVSLGGGIFNFLARVALGDHG
jgi:hypothetical protein